MANTSRVFGAKPVKHFTGAPYDGQANIYEFAVGETVPLFVGDFVLRSTEASTSGLVTVKSLSAHATDANDVNSDEDTATGATDHNSRHTTKSRKSILGTPMKSMTGLGNSNSQADVDTTRQIRQLIVDKDEFSVKAHNVNITTINGEVTLKGPVESIQEQLELEKIAKDVAGASKVNNETYISR